MFRAGCVEEFVRRTGGSPAAWVEQMHLVDCCPPNRSRSARSVVSVTAAAPLPDFQGLSMLLLYILIVIVFWSDLCEAVDYLRRFPERRQIRRTAREACNDLDLEYERLLRSYR